MTLLCLLGRHGSGKSTLGGALVRHGYTHISVGMLRRLAMSYQFPSDVPPSLMVAMRRARGGEPLAVDIASKLIKHASSFPRCVIDGFPASVEHLDLLPRSATLALVWTPKRERERRLFERAEQTQRQWVPGRGSAREESLSAVIRTGQSKGKVLFIPNRDQGLPSVEDVAETLANRLRNWPCA